jgi:xanthine dehydrogenase YagS FAD-binding subunit
VKPFAYTRPSDMSSAVSQVADDPTARFLAGGTNLVDHLRLGIAAPDLLVDVRGVTPREITERTGGGLRIGAGATNSEVAGDLRVRSGWPLLAQALLAGANGQLRNAATTGGNLLQRTRCVYFQDATAPCNKRAPGAGCSAVGGYTRYHAILGLGAEPPDGQAAHTCIATHPSDMAVALAALDTEVHVVGPGGARQLRFADLHQLPDHDPSRDTVLEHGELITAIELSPLPPGARSGYRKVRDRASFAFALVSVAAVLVVSEGRVAEVRLAFGGVAHKPWRAHTAEDALRGQAATEDNFRAAIDAELSGASPQDGVDGGNRFKVALLARTVVSVLRDLSEGAVR